MSDDSQIDCCDEVVNLLRGSGFLVEGQNVSFWEWADFAEYLCGNGFSPWQVSILVVNNECAKRILCMCKEIDGGMRDLPAWMSEVFRGDEFSIVDLENKVKDYYMKEKEDEDDLGLGL